MWSGTAAPPFRGLTAPPANRTCSKLDMQGCRFDRLNNGAPVFDTHFTGDDFKSLMAGKVGTRAQVGVVRRGPSAPHHAQLGPRADLARDQRLEIVAGKVGIEDRRAVVQPVEAAALHVELEHVRLAGSAVDPRHERPAIPDHIDGAVLGVGCARQYLRIGGKDFRVGLAGGGAPASDVDISVRKSGIDAS